MGSVNVRSNSPETRSRRVEADILGIVDGLLAADADGVLFRLNLKFIPAHARQLDDGDEILVLLKYVDWRVWASAGGRVAEPFAG